MRPRNWRVLWKAAMLRGTTFTGTYRKLRLLYSLEDPWEMASEREQHRFARTNELLTGIAPRFPSILELGCGEGHQSRYLGTLADKLVGVDISGQAVERARLRCPEHEFSVAELDAVQERFAGQRFELVTACEVLYYLPDCERVVSTLQKLCDRLFVSNYRPRAERMRGLLSGPGWRRLDDIVHHDTVWECVLWERGAVQPNSDGPSDPSPEGGWITSDAPDPNRDPPW